MSSPGQRRGKCGHVVANFDTHSHCARCRDKGKGKEPCVSDPQTSNCQICNSLTSDQQLATPSYKLKKEKREAKLTDPTPSQDSDQLVNPSSVSVIGVLDRPYSDRPAATDRPLSSEPADTGSPALHRSRRDSISSLSSEAGSMLSDNPPLDLYTEEGELSEDFCRAQDCNSWQSVG